MTHNEIFSDARWLMPLNDIDAALFRSEFNAFKGEKAEITISGLGYFILYINGKRVGCDEFVPAVSDYHDRPDMVLSYPLNDQWSHRIYCLKYDISSYLIQGENVIGVMVGGGFYHQKLRRAEGNMSYGKIKLCYKIDFQDRTVLSDKNVKYKKGFFVKSNIFYGEEQDFTGFDRKWNTVDADKRGWQSVLTGVAPKTEYYLQSCPTDKVVEILKPELVKDFGAYSVYKVEKNITGYPVIKGRQGEKIVVECAEELMPDGNIDNTSVGYGEQREIFTVTPDGEGEIHPYFCWFGFRYFSVTNNGKPVEVRVIRSDVKLASDFSCNDETLNWYWKTFINTQFSNMHGSIPSDCPHRERLGYTGDGQLTCDAVMTQLDAESFYLKWIYDICDCQDKSTGHVQHTAPFQGGGGGPAGWGGAIITVPYTFYRHYGDSDFLREVFPRMDKFVDYMESRCENGLIVREEKDGWCLGDWCTPERVSLPEPFVNTAMFITQLEKMVEVGKVLKKNTEKFERLISLHRNAVIKEYFDGTTFAQGVQGADAYALDCGAGDTELFERLCEKYKKLGEFDTGIFGTYILLDVIFRNGKGELATDLLANKKTVSFDYMRRNGATTLWENWNGNDSHSHPMFGASTIYLFKYILGIQQEKDSVRYDRVVIEPAECPLTFAQGYITTPHGKISVRREHHDGKNRFEVDLCRGIKARFIFGTVEKELGEGKNIIVIG